MEREDILARLGPDPLRADADPDRAWARICRSKITIGALLMSQDVLSGIGNVYRAEVLFRHRINPYREGRAVDPRGVGRRSGPTCARCCAPGCGPAGSSPPGRRTGRDAAGPAGRTRSTSTGGPASPAGSAGPRSPTAVDGRQEPVLVPDLPTRLAKISEVQPHQHGPVVAAAGGQDRVGHRGHAAAQHVVGPGHRERRRPGEAEAALDRLPGIGELARSARPACGSVVAVFRSPSTSTRLGRVGGDQGGQFGDCLIPRSRCRRAGPTADARRRRRCRPAGWCTTTRIARAQLRPSSSGSGSSIAHCDHSRRCRPMA